MRLCLALLALVLAAPPALAKPRIASLNMCTDQLVLALADDDQILGLSHLARRADMSFYAARAARFPVLSGQAEDALPLAPDVVATATFAKPQTRALLRRAGVAVAEFGDVQSIEQARAQIIRMGALLDQPARAAGEIARIDAALARAAAAAAGRAPATVLPLERRGWVTGRDTLVTEILAAHGLVNLGGRVAAEGRLLPLEEIVTLEPALMLMAPVRPRAEDQGAALLAHPALARLRARGAMTLPSRLSVCGGPMLAEAIDHIGAELRRTQPQTMGK